MQAIELETTLSRQGQIQLPEEHRALFGRRVRIIVLMDGGKPREQPGIANDGPAASRTSVDNSSQEDSNP